MYFLKNAHLTSQNPKMKQNELHPTQQNIETFNELL
jgi:hypothetical protein